MTAIIEKPVEKETSLTSSQIRAKVRKIIAISEPLEKLQAEFDELKKELIAIAETDPAHSAETDSGGTTWIFPDGSGRNVRIVFPIDQLLSLSESDDEKLDRVKDLAGDSFKKLFKPIKTYKPVETGKSFRTLVHALLGGRSSESVLKEISKPSSPRVSVVVDKAQ